jgi:hypothetical protein
MRDRVLTPVERDEIAAKLALRRALTYQALAESYGCSVSTIRRCDVPRETSENSSIDIEALAREVTGSLSQEIAP